MNLNLPRPLAGRGCMPHRQEFVKTRLLVIFSNPPGQPCLRLDKEDRILARLARQFNDAVHFDRLHASEVEDIHSILVNNEYDIIHFSGHGSSAGICLDRADCANGELISAKRLINLLSLANKSPMMVMLLSCYSKEMLPVLADSAPFVIMANCEVRDEACLTFAEGFYEHLFKGRSFSSSFEHARSLLKLRSLPDDSIELFRRQLIRRRDSLFVQSIPSIEHDPVLINLDAVRDTFVRFALSEEEIGHLLRKRLTIHRWIFETPRERAIIPIGKLLFGEFSWENARDVVFCKRLMRLRADVPLGTWRIWASLLNSYNDLAACEYRRPGVFPGDPSSARLLREAMDLFEVTIVKFLTPAQQAFQELGCQHLVANVVWVMSYVEQAAEQLKRNRLPEVVQSLELALTNYHEVVDGTQPPEDNEGA